MIDDLADLLDISIMPMPFPSSVTTGIGYGEVDPVLIDADTIGWALTIVRGGSLSPVDADGLRQARDDLVGSLDSFSDQARPYYARLLHIADRALGEPPPPA